MENIQAEACATGEKPTDKSHSVDRAENLENEENSDVFFSSLQISSRIVRIAALRGFSHHISSDLKLFFLCNLTTNLEAVETEMLKIGMIADTTTWNESQFEGGKRRVRECFSV